MRGKLLADRLDRFLVPDNIIVEFINILIAVKIHFCDKLLLADKVRVTDDLIMELVGNRLSHFIKCRAVVHVGDQRILVNICF